jgi:N-6 DNA Methylase
MGAPSQSESPLRNYQIYVKQLRALVAAVGTRHSPELDGPVHAALDGQAADSLRRLVPLTELRRDGIFLTGSELAQTAVRRLVPTLDARSVILDPTCGAGDLLLACVKALPAMSSLSRTMKAWERQLVGRDLHPELLEAARLRLLLAAMRLFPGARVRRQTVEHPLFPKIRVGCGLTDSSYEGATHLVMNPPFTAISASDSCSWARGQVNSAAVFLEHALRRSRPGTRIAAILPDVLRSGSRYRKWRRLVEQLAEIEHLEIGDQFNRWTDVHVFLLNLRIPQRTVASASTTTWTCPSRKDRLEERFAVRIGPVVDYRDPHEGRKHSFIRSRDLPPWGNLCRVSRTRRFSGTLIAPPFIAIRRTSRPGDTHRAVGTLVVGNSLFAVENHVICLVPHHGGEGSCRAALRNLQDPRTTEWLDQRIRCRHLTVRALAELPWWNDAS